MHICPKCKSNPSRSGGSRTRGGLLCKSCASAYARERRSRPEHRGSLKGSESPHWKGGFIDGAGYKCYVENGRRFGVHRTVMEQAIGRPLRSREVVHHWDEVKANNEIQNLCMLRHRAAHVRLHAFAKRHKIPVVKLKFIQPWFDIL